MRYLGLDWGSVRVGAAVSDPDGKLAFPLDKFIDSKGALQEIKKIIDELQVEAILIGLPKGMDGQSTDSTKEATEFIEQLKNQTPLKIELFDERLSSVAAGKTLTSMGYNAKQQREMKDNLAAQMMLQHHLDTKSKNN